jgi:uncharacterized membrane protein HdeD (DUF308 family)
MIFEVLSVGGLIAGIITIAVGIIVIKWPKVLAYVVGVYLILGGIMAVLFSLWL